MPLGGSADSTSCQRIGNVKCSLGCGTTSKEKSRTLTIGAANVAYDCGMSIDDDRDLADQLLDRGVIKADDQIIPSIRSVKQVVAEGDEDE